MSLWSRYCRQQPFVSAVPVPACRQWSPSARTHLPSNTRQRQKQQAVQRSRILTVEASQHATALSAGPRPLAPSTAVGPDADSSTTAATGTDNLTADSLEDEQEDGDQQQQLLRDITLQLSDVLWGQPAPQEHRSSQAAAAAAEPPPQQQQQPSYQQLVSVHIVLQPPSRSSPQQVPSICQSAFLTPHTLQPQHQHLTQQLHPLSFSKEALSVLVGQWLLSRPARRSGAVAVVLTGPYLPSQIEYIQKLSRPKVDEPLCCQLLLGPRGFHVVLSYTPWQQQQEDAAQQQQQDVEQKQQQQQQQQQSLENSSRTRVRPAPQQPPPAWQEVVLSSLCNPQPVTAGQLQHAREVEQSLMTNLCLFNDHVWYQRVSALAAKSKADHILSVAAVVSAANLNRMVYLVHKYPQLQVFVQQLTAVGLQTVPDPAAAGGCDKLLEVILVVAHKSYPQAALATAAAINKMSDSSPILTTGNNKTGSSSSWKHSSGSSSRDPVTKRSTSKSRSRSGIIPGCRMHVLLGDSLHDTWSAAVARIMRYRVQLQQQQQLRAYIRQQQRNSNSNSGSDTDSGNHNAAASAGNNGSSSNSNPGSSISSRTTLQPSWHHPPLRNGLLPGSKLPVLLAVSGPGLSGDDAMMLITQQRVDDAAGQTQAAAGSSNSSSRDSSSSGYPSMRWQTVFGHSLWKALTGSQPEDKQQATADQHQLAAAAAAAAGATEVDADVAAGCVTSSVSGATGVKTLWAWLYSRKTLEESAAAGHMPLHADSAAVSSGRRRRKITPVTASGGNNQARSSISTRYAPDSGSSSSSSGQGSSNVTLLLSWQELHLPQYHPSFGVLQQWRQVHIRWNGQPPSPRPVTAAAAAAAAAGTGIRAGRQTISTPAPAGRRDEVLQPAIEGEEITEQKVPCGMGSRTATAAAAAGGGDDCINSSGTTDAHGTALVTASAAAAAADGVYDSADHDDSSGEDDELDYVIEEEHLDWLMHRSVRLQTRFVNEVTYDRLAMDRAARSLGHTPLFLLQANSSVCS